MAKANSPDPQTIELLKTIEAKRAELRAAGSLGTSAAVDRNAQRLAIRKAIEAKAAQRAQLERQKLAQAVAMRRAQLGLDKPKAARPFIRQARPTPPPWAASPQDWPAIHDAHTDALQTGRKNEADGVPLTLAQYEAIQRHTRGLKAWDYYEIPPATAQRITQTRAKWGRAQRRAARRVDLAETQRAALASVTPATAPLKIHGNLITHARARKNGSSSALRLWYLARAWDVQGRGVVALPLLVDRARDVCDLSKKQVNNLVATGARVGFWTLEEYSGGAVLRLSGLAAVAQALGVVAISRAIVVDDLNQLGTLARWHALGLASWHAGKSGQRGAPIARATVANETLVVDRTQRHYAQQHPDLIKRQSNAQLVEGVTPSHLAGLNEHQAGHYFCARGNVYKRLPNTYKTPALRRARAGMQRKINANLSADLLDNRTVRGNGLELVRRFHPSISAAQKGVNAEVKRRARSQKFITGNGTHYGRVSGALGRSVAIRGHSSWGAFSL